MERPNSRLLEATVSNTEATDWSNCGKAFPVIHIETDRPLTSEGLPTEDLSKSSFFSHIRGAIYTLLPNLHTDLAA
jgi:hypothetical protein